MAGLTARRVGGRVRVAEEPPVARPPALDPARVRRALQLNVERLGPAAYLVTGGKEPHVVEGRRCDCADEYFHRRVCKHRLAAYLHRQLAPPVLEALRAAVHPPSSGGFVSLYDYQRSQVIALQDEPFYALIMAAMRQADTDNTEKLKAAWPAVWEELHARYHAPGGLLPGEEHL